MEYLCVAVMCVIAFGSMGFYIYWYYHSDNDGHWKK